MVPTLTQFDLSAHAVVRHVSVEIKKKHMTKPLLKYKLRDRMKISSQLCLQLMSFSFVYQQSHH